MTENVEYGTGSATTQPDAPEETAGAAHRPEGEVDYGTGSATTQQDGPSRAEPADPWHNEPGEPARRATEDDPEDVGLDELLDPDQIQPEPFIQPTTDDPRNHPGRLV